MKRISTLVLTGALLALAATVSAGNKAETFSISPVIGGITFDGKQHLETAPFYGVRAGYNFTKALGVEALFDYSNTESTLTSGNVDFYRAGGELLYHFFPDNKLVPYVAAGYAFGTFRGDTALPIDNRAKGVFDYGIGAKYFFTDNLALRGDVRHLIYTQDETLQAVEYSVGLYIPFGGPQPAAKPVEPPPAPEPVVVKAVEPPPAPAPPPPAPAPVPVVQPKPAPVKLCSPTVLDILFDTNKSNIKPEYYDELKKVGDFLTEFPKAKGTIEGHTDSVGGKAFNQKLSQRRAESVRDYVIKNFGIAPERINAKGYGLTKPVASNKTKEGKAKNRRIEANFSCE